MNPVRSQPRPPPPAKRPESALVKTVKSLVAIARRDLDTFEHAARKALSDARPVQEELLRRQAKTVENIDKNLGR